ncbi:MAG: PD-(D/E)XK nuclease family protein [Acidobacteria bacterium]|nr:MAG: PD-(D/E)XK nuclease family protein [Acidobacteriota bacterium]REK08355.1 MAG: PD-(D/E)XK nuclease family protein [Acidobacteriota bacterium]
MSDPQAPPPPDSDPEDPFGDLWSGDERVRGGDDGDDRGSGDGLHVRREFLGDDGPLLPRAAAWIVEQYGEPGRLDLERTLVVVSGRRAGRSLLAHLVSAAGPRMVFPPRAVTVGALVEVLQPPRIEVAGPLEELVARTVALRGAPREEISAAFGEVPAADDESAWMEIATTCQSVERELSGAAFGVRDAIRLLARSGVYAALEDDEMARWRALGALVEASEAELEERGLQSRWLHRRRAAFAGAARDRWERDWQRVVLVGVVELGRLQRQVIERSGLEVVSLVHCEAGLAELFDGWGGVLARRWQRKVPRGRSGADAVRSGARGTPGAGSVPVETVVVERPVDQAAAVARLLAADGAVSRPATSHTVVAVPDARLARAVGDALAGIGRSSHSPFGRPLAASQPMVALRALVGYAERRGVDDLARLVRLPAFARWVERQGGDEPDAEPADGGGAGASLVRRRELLAAVERHDWPTLLDHYAAVSQVRRLPTGAEGWRQLPGEPAVVAALRRLDRCASRLLAGSAEPGDGGEALDAAERLVAPLVELFGDVRAAAAGDTAVASPGRHDGEAWGPAEWAALERLGDELRALARLPEARRWSDRAAFEAISAVLREEGPSSPQSTVHEASRLGEAATAGEATAPIPVEVPVEVPVEIVGWLEVAHDDAPEAVVVGLNEGYVPARRSADPFLGESVRSALGLADDAQRLGRDRFLLRSLARSRQRLTLVAGRRTADGEPLLPSRLLLEDEGAELARSVAAFFGPAAAHLGDAAASSLLVAEPYRPPAPDQGIALPERLPVTAFRDYLQCPYRFYLRHVLAVQSVAAPQPELDAPLFGVLAHEVLQRFAQGPLQASRDAATISRWLLRELEALARRQLGTELPPAVQVQLHQLARRLDRFAAWQAQQAEQGWRIENEWTERRAEAELDLEGGRRVTVVGRIDRVDVHPRFGVRVIDYKTGDSPLKPKQVHLRGGRWVDLQLPLYRHLVSHARLADRPELGFYALSKKLAAEPWLAVDWDEAQHQEALAVARETAAAILARRFWPPAEPPRYADGYEWICGDSLPSFERAAGIDAPEGAQA